MSKSNHNLEKRCFDFAKLTRKFFSSYKVKLHNLDDVKQVIRSSASIGANYIEANENLGTKDFLMRIKICKKEAKETVFWLRLIQESSNEINVELSKLIDEAFQLQKIFGAIYQKISTRY